VSIDEATAGIGSEGVRRQRRRRQNPEIPGRTIEEGVRTTVDGSGTACGRVFAPMKPVTPPLTSVYMWAAK